MCFIFCKWCTNINQTHRDILNCVKCKANAYKYYGINNAIVWKQNLCVYLSLLLFLGPCVANPNYTLILSVSSHVLVQDEVFNYVLAGEEVTLMATAHRNNNSANFTDSTNQSQAFYYSFQCRNRTGGEWYSISCSEESTAVEVWDRGGDVECLVHLLTQDNKTLTCNATSIIIAGNVQYWSQGVRHGLESHMPFLRFWNLESCVGRKTLRILYLKVFQLPWNLILESQITWNL